MAQLDDTARNLPQEGRVRRLKVLAVALRWNHAGTRANHFVEEEVVKDPIAAQDQDVTLIGGDTVDCTPLLYDLQRNGLIEVLIDAPIYSCKLQRRLHVEVDALHFRVKDRLKLALPSVSPPEHQQLAVTDGEHSDHGVQLAMNLCAIVQCRQKHCGRAKALCGFVGLLEQGDGPPVGILRRDSHVRHELRHGQLFASLEQLVGQQRRIHVELLQL
mmetsp:Transcript_54296/g.126422  ORF Transcript_54296/g.126422 Transcript_54296/m.126422 type:complete len:216 (-) Transcript_54296:352-999(-)